MLEMLITAQKEGKKCSGCSSSRLPKSNHSLPLAGTNQKPVSKGIQETVVRGQYSQGMDIRECQSVGTVLTKD